MSEVSSADASPNHDAQLAQEAISEGDEKTADVNVAADYEASKEFSVSSIDKTGEGEAAAAAATAHQRDMPAAESSQTVAQPTGKPEDYVGMAKEVGHAPAGKSEVSDDLVEHAIEMSQPAESPTEQ